MLRCYLPRLVLFFLRLGFVLFGEFGEEDADEIEDEEGGGDDEHVDGIGGGGDDGGEDHDAEDGVAPIFAQHLAVDKTDFGEGKEDEGHFEGDADPDEDSEDEGDVVF